MATYIATSRSDFAMSILVISQINWPRGISIWFYNFGNAAKLLFCSQFRACCLFPISAAYCTHADEPHQQIQNPSAASFFERLDLVDFASA